MRRNIEIGGAPRARRVARCAPELYEDHSTPVLLMSVFAIIIAVVVLVLVVASKSASRRKPRGEPRSGPINSEPPKPEFKVDLVATNPLTTTEAIFFRRLMEALPEAIVVPQMAMAALVDLAPHMKRGRYVRYIAINRSSFAQKRIDFVLLDRDTLEVACVVELDDYSHDAADRKEEDEQRDALLEGLGYTVIRFDCRKMPAVADLREQFGV